MVRKKKEIVEGEIVELEKIGNKSESTVKIFNVSEGFYYLLGAIISLVLMFATNELLSTINYLFVLIFAIVSVIQIGLFIWKKEYEKKNYSGLVVGIASIWIAIFIYKYGGFLFMEMLPVLSSLLLFIMGASSLTKYLDNKRIGNLIISVMSFILGFVLIFISSSIMYILFKITGCYILFLIIFDFIDYIKNKK